MLAPKFRCAQDDRFVTVELSLVAHCKVGAAQFDICDKQFTFHCSPYYLRLTFSHDLIEGAGERATYDVATHTMTVFLPKAVPGVEFEGLDFPNMLLATAKQRRRLVQAVRTVGEDGEEASSSDSELDVEMPQAVADDDDDEPSGHYYGFNDEARGCFARWDPAACAAVVDLPAPDSTPPAERWVQREAEENAAFDEGAVAFSMADEDGDVDRLLAFRPWYVVAFEDALRADGVAFVQKAAPKAAAPAPPMMYATPGDVGRFAAAFEEEDVPTAEAVLPGGGPVVAWQGNVADFERKEDNADDGACPPPAPRVVDDAAEAHPGITGRVACPAKKPTMTFTLEESEALARLPPRSFLLVAEHRTWHLVVELLAAYCYDHITTEGEGTSESLWTVAKLSPALSWLQAQDTMADVCVAFVRRVLTFPLHRHFGLAMRCLRDVGVLLLSGRGAVVRALLHVKQLLDHAETKHVLSQVWLQPLLCFLTAQPAAAVNKTLEQVAIRLHEFAVGGRMESPPPGAMVSAAARRDGAEPMGLFNLGLPIE